jgi:uncharacterized protein YndB with AHSA1/START domain
MATIEGELTIACPVESLFDYLADERNEPRYNSKMVSAEKVDATPIGAGTRFRALVRSGGRTAPMLIEITDYDRPHRLVTATTMAQADITYVLNFEPVPVGTRMSWSGQVRAKGAFRLLDPLITWLGRRQEERIWHNMKQHVEERASGTPPPAGS